MREICLDGVRVATTSGGVAVLEERVAALPAQDPLRRFAAALCLFSIAVDEGSTSGTYDDERAARFARAILVPEDLLLEAWAQADAELAVRFAVPLEQLIKRRAEIAQGE